MIEFDFSTIYMTIIASNILLIVISLLMLNKKILHNIGYKLLATFLILTMVRFLLPLEFSFTKNISLPEVISEPLQVIYTSVYSNDYIDIQYWTIAFIICLSISIVLIILLLLSNRYEHLKILIYGTHVSMIDPFKSTLKQICDERGIKNIFKVYYLEDCTTPYTYGIFRPYIVLPTSLELEDDVVYYVLSHEINHYIHRDLLLKFGVQVLARLYWWNPFSYLLVTQADLLIEMRIDDKVTSTDGSATKEYINCLHYISDNNKDKKKKFKTTAVSFGVFDDSDYVKRVYALKNKDAKKNYLVNVIITLVIVGIYCASYMYVLEANYNKPEDIEPYMEVTTMDMYIIDNQDGTYDVYYGSIHVETVTSLENFHKDVRVYKKEDFINETEKH